MKLPNYAYKKKCYWVHMITFRCNGKCPFCLLNGRGRSQMPEELSAREILDFWNNIEHEKGQKLSLIGGEPTLHPEIVEIVNNLEHYSLTLTTNCTGPFHEDPEFYKKLRPHRTSGLRINTTFHPHHISPERYNEVISLYSRGGFRVDQVSHVHYPGVGKFKEAIRITKSKPFPFLGFFNEKDGFDCTFDPENLHPNEDYFDKSAPGRVSGLKNMDAYRAICGQPIGQEVECPHPEKSMIIGPNGNYYHCHYKLYYDIDPVSNIRDFKPLRPGSNNCRHYGLCSPCDVPRMGCAHNKTTRPLTLTKLYDKRERQRPEIDYLFRKIVAFSKKYKLECNNLKWFEYAAVMLYSGHKHRGKVLEVGSAKSAFPYFLASEGYKVTTIDVADGDYRADKAEKFGIESLNWDLRELNEDLVGKFDLVSNLSVIEHIDRDTDAVLNLAKYLKTGGVMVISTDFYPEYIEYPDANRTIVRDRPDGSHTDSRVYTPEAFMQRIVEPLERIGVRRCGATDFENVDLNDPKERSVRGLYTFGVACVRRDPDGV